LLGHNANLVDVAAGRVCNMEALSMCLKRLELLSDNVERLPPSLSWSVDCLTIDCSPPEGGHHGLGETLGHLRRREMVSGP